MPSWGSAKASAVLAALERIGWRVVRQTGSHKVLARDGWPIRQAEEHARVLARHPFDDRSAERVDLVVALRSKGLSDEAAWQTACEKYRLPGPD